jgi:hypothetical protein
MLSIVSLQKQQQSKYKQCDIEPRITVTKRNLFDATPWHLHACVLFVTEISGKFNFFYDFFHCKI